MNVVLDDWQRCAASYADWDGRGWGVEHEHLLGDPLVARLAGDEPVVVMREADPFDANLLVG